MMENPEINEKILEIWKNEDYETEMKDIKLLPILYPKFKKNSILFIGLNPSFSKKNITNTIKGIEDKYKNINFKDAEKKLNRVNIEKKESIELSIDLEREANNKNNYFKKLKEISNDNYQHIDLFYFRATNQKEAKDKISKSNENTNIILNDFAIAQLKVAHEMIEKINPKVIVVINAFASDIITRNKYNKKPSRVFFPGDNILKINDDSFKEKGYDSLEINDGIPILFSSMLSGQRALDNHTYRRLKWQIRKIYDN